MVKKSPRPADYFTTNFHAIVDSEACEGCCVERCQMEALSLINNISTVDYDKCIGCCNCVVTCESNAIKLQKKENEMVPPKDFEKRGFLATMKMMGKMLLKKQI